MSIHRPAALPNPSFLDSSVDTSVEAGWLRLEAQLELSAGFWLGFVFCGAAGDVDDLRKNATRLLANHGKTHCFRKLDSSELFSDLLHWLLNSPEAANAECVWIESIISDPIGSRNAPFKKAWENFFLRANQKRDALRKVMRGGLVFAAPPAIKPLVRDAAPDLWSVRSLVIDIASSDSSFLETTRIDIATPQPGPVVTDMPDFTQLRSELPEPSLEQSATPNWRPRSSASNRSSRPHSNALADEARQRATQRTPPKRFLFTSAEYDAIDALITSRRLQAAEAQTRALIDVLGSENVLDLAFAYYLLSKVDELKADAASALRAMDDAIASYQKAAPEFVPADWYLRAGYLAMQCGNDDRALTSFSTAVDEAKRRVHENESVDTLHHLVASLQGLGEWKGKLRKLDSAIMIYHDAVIASRRLVDLRGNDLESLHGLLTSLVRFGDACRDRHDYSNALAAFEETVPLAEKMCRVDRESQWSLGQLSIALNRVGGVQQSIGEWENARNSYQKSLAHRRRLVTIKGNSESYNRLISVLKKLAVVEEHLGNDDLAAKLVQEYQLLEERLRT